MISCVGFVSKHSERDLDLSKSRDRLLKKTLRDLTADPDVLGIYQSGSLAKGNFDCYSDIDLHIIVPPEKKDDFIKNKRQRATRWGKVLFFEGRENTPVVVTHFDCFVKIDSWYRTPDELQPSIWLQGIKANYDPHHLIKSLIEASTKIVYKPAKEDVQFWREKVLSFMHETYRSVMREEKFYAQANLDSIRWLIVSGWYMEKEQHMDTPPGSWSKVGGKRSGLNHCQLAFLESWQLSFHTDDIMHTMIKMIPEFLRLNKQLSNQTGLEANEEEIQIILSRVV